MAFLNKSWLSLNVVNISWAMSMRLCFCSKISNFGTIFAAPHFIPKKFVKIAWHEPNVMPTASATFLIMIIQKHFHYCCNIFIRCWRTRATRTCIVTELFSAFLKPVIPQLNLCSAHSTLAKCHSQHFKCPCTFNFIFTQDLIPFLWSIFSNSKI